MCFIAEDYGKDRFVSETKRALSLAKENSGIDCRGALFAVNQKNDAKLKPSGEQPKRF